MKICLLSFLLFFLPSAFASQTSIGGNLGFEQGAAVVGLDLDYRTKKDTAYHGYLLYGMGSESFSTLVKTELQKIAVGGGIKILFGPKRWQLSLTPGLGATMLTLKTSSTVNGLPFEEVSDTLFGPILRTEALYRFSKKTAFGLNHTIQANWFSSNFGGTLSFTTLSVRMRI